MQLPLVAMVLREASALMRISSILVYTTKPVRDQLNPSPCTTRLLQICRNALYAIHLFRCWRCACVALRFCRPNVIIRVYLYISGCIYIFPAVYIYVSLAVLIYLRLYLYISGCIYISLAVFIYSYPAKVIISPAVLIYLRLSLIINIAGCTYISPAVFI